MYVIVFLAALIVGAFFLKKLILILTGIVVAGLVGALADKVVPGELPYGIPGAIMAGWLGFILGHKLIGDLGPSLGGIHLLPAFLGAVIIAFVVEVVGSKKAT